MLAIKFTKILGLAGLLGFGFLNLHAVAQPAQDQQEVFKEIQIAQDKFSRGVSPPAWVQVEMSIPESQNPAPMVYRLADTQFFAGDNLLKKPSTYVRRVLKVNDNSALQQLSTYSLGFSANYQNLQLNKLSIWRDNVEINKTLTANIRFLQRETGLEKGLYDGEVTVSILIDDLRVGDSLDIAYTSVGSNPVMGEKYSDSSSVDQSIPTEWRKIALSYPENRAIQWRVVGDLNKNAPKHSESTANGMKQHLWEEKSLKPVTPEDYVPVWFHSYRLLQFTEYTSWGEVAKWGEQLFQNKGELPQEAQALLAKVRLLATQQEQVSAILQWVQSQVRYFSVSLGESSHRPHLPAETLRARYGDCKDKTFLMVELLRGLGISAQPVLVNARVRFGINKNLPTPQVFDHVIVHVKLGDKQYYLDPTRQGQTGRLDRMGQLFENAEVLILAPQTSDLVTIKTPNNYELLVDMLSEKIVVNKFGDDATISISHTLSGTPAENRRVMYAKGVNKHLFEKTYKENYENRYPGLKQVGAMLFTDDESENIFIVEAQYAGPKVAITAGTEWGVRYAVSNMQGALNKPPSAERSQPTAMPSYPRKINYRVDIDFPEDVSVLKDPAMRTTKDKTFEYVQNLSFRGNKASTSISLEILEPEFEATYTSKYLESLRKFEESSHRVYVVNKNDIKQSGMFGIGKKSLNQTLIDRMNETIIKVGKTIADNKLSGDDLAEALCTRANALNDLDKLDEALNDANLAVKTAPNYAQAYTCRADAWKTSGNFANAISDYSKAITLSGEDHPPYHARGRARFFAGQLEAAMRDFEKAVSLEKENSDSTLYPELWRVMSQKRLKINSDEKQLKFASSSIKGQWPRPALAMLHGLLSVEDMLKSLDSLSGDDKTLALTEAYFYIGQAYESQGSKDKAIEYYKKTREFGVINYSEHVGAGLALKQLGVQP